MDISKCLSSNDYLFGQDLTLLKHGLHDIGLLFMPDRFPESDTKNSPEYECLHGAWKTAQ